MTDLVALQVRLETALFALKEAQKFGPKETTDLSRELAKAILATFYALTLVKKETQS